MKWPLFTEAFLCRIMPQSLASIFNELRRVAVSPCDRECNKRYLLRGLQWVFQTLDAQPFARRQREARKGVILVAKSTGPKVEVARSAKTGQFVTKTYAQKHPATTEVEHYKKSATAKK